MSFHSSCIFYSNGIERALKEGISMNMDFSLYCGSRERYQKIKRIEELGIKDHCWEFSRRVLEEGGIPKGY